MRKLKLVQKDGINYPDWPEGQDPNDPDIVAIECNGEECIVYEVGDDIPERLRPRLHVLRDLPDDLVLWRYMKADRFKNLLEKKALYFTPGHKLRELETYELRIPLKWEKNISEVRDKQLEVYIPDEKERKEFIDKQEKSFESSYLYETGISCWHMNSVENHAFWQIYIGKDENGNDQNGVAIKTTLGRLKKALSLEKRYISADQMTYIDYQYGAYEQHPSAIGYERIYSKCHFYKYEQEFRMAYSYPGDIREYNEKGGPNSLLLEHKDPANFAHTQREYFITDGPFVPVNLGELIEVVVIRAFDEQFPKTVQDLVAQHISADVPITGSAVYKWPDGK